MRSHDDHDTQQGICLLFHLSTFSIPLLYLVFVYQKIASPVFFFPQIIIGFLVILFAQPFYSGAFIKSSAIVLSFFFSSPFATLIGVSPNTNNNVSTQRRKIIYCWLSAFKCWLLSIMLLPWRTLITQPNGFEGENQMRDSFFLINMRCNAFFCSFTFRSIV